MSSLDRIHISGFKSIKSTSLDLLNLNVLIGANGAGKSNFVTIFELLNQIVENNLQLFVGKAGGVDSLLHFGKKSTDQIDIQLYFGQNGYECTLVPTSTDALVFSDEQCLFQGKGYNEPYRIRLGSGHKETNIHEEAKKASGRVARYVLKSLKSWKVYHFHDTSESARVKQTCNINDNRFLRPDAGNLAAFLYLLREQYNQYYENIVSIIQTVAPFFEDFALRPSPFNPEMIRLEWKHKGSDAYFDANSLSDGTIRFICLTTLLLQPNLPTTILLDEPELGLHPYAITMLANLLESASTKTQVIASTQSVTLVNQLVPNNIIVVDRDNQQSTFRRLTDKDMEHWLEEYGLGDLWEKNILGGRPQ